MKIISVFLLCISFAIPLPSFAVDGQGKSYNDGHGGKVFFPLGDISFADKVVRFKQGNPAAAKKDSNPAEALGIPDYSESKDDNYLTLGCGGSVVLQFTDNALVDVKGPDLYVFEIGAEIEPTALWLSKDNKDWVLVGIISGGKSAVDISDYVDSDEVFRYVRLTDMRSACNRQFPGADIDAVGAIGSGVKFSFSSAVLFDTGKHNLKPAASRELNRLLSYIKQAGVVRIVIEGHTDSVGSDSSNLVLSRNRANAVKLFLTSRKATAEGSIVIQGYGESQPIDSNKTAQGRAKNRRVEVVVTRQSLQAPVSPVRNKKKLLGIWNSSDSILQLEMVDRNGNAVGRYTKDNGELTGKFVKANRFAGYWIEDESNRKCDKARNGRYYWGRINMDFSANHESFKGVWGYCNDAPTKTNWNGASLLH